MLSLLSSPPRLIVPARPKPLLNAMLGAVTALFLGLCAVYVAEAGRNTVATPRELDVASRYPVLATLSAECGQLIHGVEGTVVGRERALPPMVVHTTRPPDFVRISNRDEEANVQGAELECRLRRITVKDLSTSERGKNSRICGGNHVRASASRCKPHYQCSGLGTRTGRWWVHDAVERPIHVYWGR